MCEGVCLPFPSPHPILLIPSDYLRKSIDIVYSIVIKETICNRCRWFYIAAISVMQYEIKQEVKK